MGLLKRIRDWDASHDESGQRRAGVTPRPPATPSSEAMVVSALLKLVAALEPVFGVLGGLLVGLSNDDAGGGFDGVGLIVIVGALVNALLFWALAAGLGCLDEIRRNTGRSAAT